VNDSEKDIIGVMSFMSFMFLVVWLLYMDINRIVDVHICTQNELTTYVGRQNPPQELKMGSCYIEAMKNKRYRHLRRAMRATR